MTIRARMVIRARDRRPFKDFGYPAFARPFGVWHAAKPAITQRGPLRADSGLTSVFIDVRSVGRAAPECRPETDDGRDCFR